jgi:hypothetical protein
VSDDRFANYRRGVETGTMKSATPNVVRDCLEEIDRVLAQHAKLQAENERLRAENDKLREISLRRFIGCMSGGSIEDNVYVPSQWHWSCSLCGAQSSSDSDTENLDHKADCPILWIRENCKAARSK